MKRFEVYLEQKDYGNGSRTYRNVIVAKDMAEAEEIARTMAKNKVGIEDYQVKELK